MIRSMALNGIETRAVFHPLHLMPIYEKYTGGKSFPNSRFISDYGICLPSASTTSEKEILKVSHVFKTTLESLFLTNKVLTSGK